jgi:hypothetical protein
VPALATLVVVLLLAEPARSQTEGSGLTPAVTTALARMLECERPEGGWTYVCQQGIRTWGATSIVNTAERIAGPFGLATWDLVVLRSPGTPAAGQLLVDAYRRAPRAEYLHAARRTGDLLIGLQLPSGGWFSEVPVHGTRPALWFRLFARWTTLDDDVTPGAARFLLALWEITQESRYRDAAERALDLLLRAQLPSGAWPLTWRPALLRRLSPTFEDLPSTNDAATTGAIMATLAGARVLARPDLLAAARRGGEWLRRSRGKAPLAAWAQQYADGRPVGGRRFEHPALASWESRLAVDALLALASATGDLSYCRPVAAALRWLAEAAVEPGCWARFYDAASGRAFYVDAAGRRVASVANARRGYAWRGDYGIPALLHAVGLDAALPPQEAPARERLPGDSGVCAGERSSEEKLVSRHTRSRIAGTGVLLGALEPPERGACTAVLRRTAGH